MNPIKNEKFKMKNELTHGRGRHVFRPDFSFLILHF